MNEKELLELEYKSQHLQFQIIQFVLTEFPEVKPELKPVLLEMAGVGEKAIRDHLGLNNPREITIIDSDDESIDMDVSDSDDEVKVKKEPKKIKKEPKKIQKKSKSKK